MSMVPHPKECYFATTRCESMVTLWARNILLCSQLMGEGCPKACWPFQSSSHRSESGGHQILYPRWSSNQEGGMYTPHSSSGRCLSQHETATPKPPQSRASWYTGEFVRNPQIPTLSINQCTAGGSQEQNQLEKSGPSTPTTDLVTPLHSKS